MALAGGVVATVSLAVLGGMWVYSLAGWKGAESSERIAFLTLCAGGACVLHYYSPAQFWSAFGNLRWERVVHYAGLYFLGVWLSHPPEVRVVTVMVGAVCVMLAWGSAVATNDVTDIKIDKVSNRGRPLVTGAWKRGEYLWLGWALGVLSLTGAALISTGFAVCTLAGLVTAFLYSNPPCRLRRFLGVSSVLVGVASLFVAVAGFISLGDRAVPDFPVNIAWFLFLGLTLGANLKDIKDCEGDRHDGVHTLVTVLGLRAGRIVVGALVAAAMLMGPLLLDRPKLVAPALAWAGLAWILCVRQPFREKPVFLLYYTYLAFLAWAGALRPVS